MKMVNNRLKLVFAFTILLLLSACVAITEQQLIDDGATRLDGEQVKAHLSGKTERWPNYETFYSADGKVEVLWDKVKSRGSWEVSTGGKVCITVPKWGNVCHSYLDDHGAITRIEKGISVGVKEVIKGKQLSR